MPYFSRTHRSYLPASFNYYFSAAHAVVLILTVVCFYLTQFSDEPKRKTESRHLKPSTIHSGAITKSASTFLENIPY